MLQYCGENPKQLTLWVWVCVLHDFGELLIHPFNQSQNASSNPERLQVQQQSSDDPHDPLSVI